MFLHSHRHLRNHQRRCFSCQLMCFLPVFNKSLCNRGFYRWLLDGVQKTWWHAFWLLSNFLMLAIHWSTDGVGHKSKCQPQNQLMTHFRSNVAIEWWTSLTRLWTPSLITSKRMNLLYAHSFHPWGNGWKFFLYTIDTLPVAIHCLGVRARGLFGY